MYIVITVFAPLRSALSGCPLDIQRPFFRLEGFFSLRWRASRLAHGFPCIKHNTEYSGHQPGTSRDKIVT